MRLDKEDRGGGKEGAGIVKYKIIEGQGPNESSNFNGSPVCFKVRVDLLSN